MKNQPDTLIAWPPPYVLPKAGTSWIGRERKGVVTFPVHVALGAWHKPDVAVVVQATRLNFAVRMAVRWARKFYYGETRITRIAISFVHHV